MTGTPACRSAVAWSVIAMVLDGRSALTVGLMDASTASALTADILLALAAVAPFPHALVKRTELGSEAGLVGVEKDGAEEVAGAAAIAS